MARPTLWKQRSWSGLVVYWLGIALYAHRLAETRWVWALPFVLSIDNITYGLIDHAWSSLGGGPGH